MTHHCMTMYAFHVWANKRVIERLKELPDEVAHQEINSVFPTVAKALTHIYVVDNGWLGIISGNSMADEMAKAEQLRETAESRSIAELEGMFDGLAEQFKAFLHKQTDLEQTIVLDNPYAGVRDTSLAEMVMQVVNHGTFHRGNISAMLRQLGHSSVMTEYALYWYSK